MFTVFMVYPRLRFDYSSLHNLGLDSQPPGKRSASITCFVYNWIRAISGPCLSQHLVLLNRPSSVTGDVADLLIAELGITPTPRTRNSVGYADERQANAVKTCVGSA